MVNFDFSPYYGSTIGFDRLARLLDETARQSDMGSGFPPYNIAAINEDHSRVTLAVAGFSMDDLTIEVLENALVISGTKKDETADRNVLHRGFANKTFKQQFRLADHIKVENAWLDNGMLTIDLVREVPEAMKPRRIDIKTGAPKAILSKARKLLGGEDKAA